MSPEELYARTPEEIVQWNDDTWTLGQYFHGAYFNFIPELPDHICQLFDPKNRIEFHIYKDFNFDGRRFWRLCGVWYKGKPVMILQNAGREGDDYSESFITDFIQYKRMTKYLRKHATMHDDTKEDDERIVDPSVDMGIKLTEFYGNELDGYFERYHY